MKSVYIVEDEAAVRGIWVAVVEAVLRAERFLGPAVTGALGEEAGLAPAAGPGT